MSLQRGFRLREGIWLKAEEAAADIRITPVACGGHKSAKLMHVINSIGDRITYADAYAMVKNCFDYDLIDGREAKIIISALNEKSLCRLNSRFRMKSEQGILKNMLISAA